MMTENDGRPSRQLAEVAGLFLKLGTTAFGGPAAHIGLMHDEFVRRRRWLNDEEFLDLLGATNLIPGPNSTEMAIHLGFRRAGWRGLILAGLCFVLPATVIVLILAWTYVKFGALPQAQWLLYGVKPVIIAVIAQAIWTLGRRAVKNSLLLAGGLLVVGLYEVWHLNEILLLFGGGVAVMLFTNIRRITAGGIRSLLPLPILGSAVVAMSGAATVPFGLATLFLTFLKIGAILYGSGYVLLAFLHADFVTRLGWLTDQQLLDAIAVGQISPGPLFTSATFVGYLLGGVPGALLGTLGIFLPSFLFVAISNPLIPKMRKSPWVGSFLDGVNVAALGLMVTVTFRLGAAALVDIPTVLVALLALLALLRFRINSTWLIAGGASFGLLMSLLR